MSDAELLFSTEEAGQRINVWQQEDRRWLEFDDDLIQTEINLDRPDYLPESFSRAMLAGVLFTETPKRVLLAGAGGGSTARYFASRFPEVEGASVEISKTIVDLAKDYFECPHTGHWQLIKADIKDHVKSCEERYDLVVIDIAVDQKTPDWLVGATFLQDCRSILTEFGHVSINLIVESDDEFLRCLASIRQVFDQQTVCLSLKEHKNILVFAFNQRTPFSTEQLMERAELLKQQWQVEFPEFYAQMRADNPKDSGLI